MRIDDETKFLNESLRFQDAIIEYSGPRAGIILDLQRLLTLSLAFIPPAEHRLKAEIEAALKIRP